MNKKRVSYFTLHWFRSRVGGFRLVSDFKNFTIYIYWRTLDLTLTQFQLVYKSLRIKLFNLLSSVQALGCRLLRSLNITLQSTCINKITASVIMFIFTENQALSNPSGACQSESESSILKLKYLSVQDFSSEQEHTCCQCCRYFLLLIEMVFQRSGLNSKKNDKNFTNTL